MAGLNLADMYYSWIHKPHIDRDQPWLWADPNHVADVVFSRSPRYHGNFPWRRAVNKYRGRSVFLGMPEEHEAFCREFGEVPYHPTKDLWEVACIIAGAKLVLVNQTCNFWITEALKRPVCLEACESHRNCHWGRTGAIYGTSQLMELPDVELLDERLAWVCAERDQDRSLLSFEKKLGLARCALECSGLPGDAAELGVFRGGAASIIAAALPGKTLHCFDTFAGIPADDTIEGGHKKGEMAADLADVQKFLAGYRVEFHPGFFPGTADAVKDQRFAFVHLDGDLYQSTADALDFFLPRMVPGGSIVLDDLDWQNCPGVRKAVDERGLKVEVTAPHQGRVRVCRAC